MKRAEISCVDKIRSLSERKAKREAKLKSHKVSQVRKSSEKVQKGVRPKSKSLRPKRSDSSKFLKTGSNVMSRIARCEACPQRGFTKTSKLCSRSLNKRSIP